MDVVKLYRALERRFATQISSLLCQDPDPLSDSRTTRQKLIHDTPFQWSAPLSARGNCSDLTGCCGVVPKGFLTFLGSLYKEVARTSSGTLVYRFERQTA